MKILTCVDLTTW